MATTFSPNLGISLMATGDAAGTWGDITNTNLGTLLEQAVSGYVTQAITDSPTATTITLINGATSVARNMYLELTGTLTAARVLEVPTNKKLYFIYNNTTGGFAVTVKVSGQTGISVPNGQKTILVCNGTDIIAAQTYLSSIALGSALPIASGGTGATTAQGARNSIAGGVNNGYFLRGDGSNVLMAGIQTTDVPLLNQNTSGSAGSVLNSLTINNSGAGVVSGSVFNGAGAVTISYNTIGAYAATNPSGYTSNTGTVTSIVASTTPQNGLSLSGGTITGSGTIAITGSISGVALTTAVSGILPTGNGGTNLSSFTSGGAVYASSTSVLTTGTLPTASGGTNLTSFTSGGAVYATSTSALTTGTLPIASGGTAAITAAAAANNLLPAQATHASQYLQTDGAGNLSWAPVSGASGGTVTQVTFPTAPAFLTASVATNTTTPAISLSYSGTAIPVANGGTASTTAQGAINTLAGAVTTAQFLRGNGTNVVMSAIQTTDVPTLNQSTTGNALTATTAGNVTGTVAIGNGGTGQTSANAAINALLPSQATFNTRVLGTDGTNTSWVTVGAGTVTSVGMTVPAFLSVSPGTITSTGTFAVTLSGTAIPVANGGTASTTAQGAINTLAGGVTSGNFLRGNGTNIVLSTLQSGDIPNNGASTTGTAAGLSATLGLGFGGTGATTAQGAINALAGAVTSAQFLRGNGTNVVMSAIQATDVPTLNQATTQQAGSVANLVTFNNGGAGAASGTTYNGGAAVTVSYNTIGAYAASNPSGYTANAGTVTSVAGTGATNGLSLSGTVTTSGNITLGGSVTSVATGATIDGVVIGYRNVPASANTTAATADVGKCLVTTGTITVPNSTFAAGDIISIFNNSAGNITVTCNMTTTYLAGTATTGTTRTLAQRGMATVYFISSTVAVISGTGLT